MSRVEKGPRQAVVLCVEDEEDLREILVEELEDAGYVVVQARNGNEALTQLKALRPTLILCDIAMPGMDGYELLRVIRETLPEMNHVPFVFLTAQDGSSQITEGKCAGADDYLVKPINFDLMLATIAARIRQVERMLPQLDSLSTASDTHHERKAFYRISHMFNLISSGVVLLNNVGEVQFANDAAKRLASNEISPALGELLTSKLDKQRAAWSLVIQEAIDAGRMGEDYTRFFSLPRVDEQRDLLVTVCTLSDTNFASNEWVAVLFIAGSNRDESAPLKALEALFKLTATEGRVAWAFAQGMRPEQIAATFDISATTVAFHKRNIFQKTNTNRQADLIALLLTVPTLRE